MNKKYDTFDYETTYITYKNSYTPGDDLLRCVFIINGKDILELVKEASKTEEDFHHTTLSDLWAFDLDDDPYESGRIHPLICSCDDLGCDNITVKVTESEDAVIWNNFHDDNATSDKENDDDLGDLKLSFEFEKNDYKQKMEKLKTLAHASCRK